jgi:hypothetical protein
LVRRDRADDVGGDQEIESEQETPSDLLFDRLDPCAGDERNDNGDGDDSYCRDLDPLGNVLCDLPVTDRESF